MKNSGRLVIILIFIVSCSNKRNDGGVPKDSISQEINATDTGKSKIRNTTSVSFNNNPDFLEISKHSTESYIGYLQGVEKSDSSGPFYMREFISDSLSFDLIFFPKNLNKGAVDFVTIKEASVSDYRDFVCFAFVYPMKDVEIGDANYHSDNTPYPVLVKSYIKKEGGWILVSEQKAKNLADLSQYEVNTMYKNLKQ
jgi:hypothetical protein